MLKNLSWRHEFPQQTILKLYHFKPRIYIASKIAYTDFKKSCHNMQFLAVNELDVAFDYENERHMFRIV